MAEIEAERKKLARAAANTAAANTDADTPTTDDAAVADQATTDENASDENVVATSIASKPEPEPEQATTQHLAEVDAR